MGSVQKAIIPGMIAGCLFIIFFARMMIDPSRSLALAEAAAAASLLSASSGAFQVADDVRAMQPPKPETAQPDPQPEIQQPVEEQAQPPSGCTISASYPESIQQWCPVIGRFASEYGVDSNLIAAVMLQESGGNPNAYSKSGAVGLMQVMPRDGLAASFQCKNGPCFASRPSMDELYDPEFNISYGTRMLAGLIERQGGVRDALHAYGPMDMGYRYADIVLSIYERNR
jgi:soluble lytic murein transglycosylase-like protein